MQKKQLLAVVLGVLAVSCAKGKSKATSSDAPPTEQATTDAPVKSDANGVVVASLDGKTSQRVNASATSGIAGTSILFPAGSLAIATDVTVEEGVALDLDAMKAELTIASDTPIVAATGTLVLKSSEPIDFSKPAQVSMPYNATAALTGDMKPALLYHVVRQDQGGKSFVGIDAATTLVIADGKVTFSVSYFGAYAVVMVPSTLADVKGVPTERPLPAGKSEAPKDTTTPGTGGALAVTAHTPDGTVARPTSVTITFDRNVDGPSAAAGIIVAPHFGLAMEGSVSVNEKTATFTPTRGFVLGAVYDVTVQGAVVRGSAGESMAEDSSFQFTVADGSWTAPALLTGMETSPSLGKLVPLNNGRFGAAVGIGSGGSYTKISVWDGTAWSAAETVSYSPKYTQLVDFAGGTDGRFYSFISLGETSPVSTAKPSVNRKFPALGSVIDLVGTAANFSAIRAAPLAPGKALFLMVSSADQSVTAKVVAGDTAGAVETVAPAATGRYDQNLASSSVGVAAYTSVNYISTPSSHYVLTVRKRAADGTWTDLTPPGSELDSTTTLPDSRVAVSATGKITVFWCVDTDCKARTHDGAAWSAVVPLSLASPVSVGLMGFSSNGISDRIGVVLNEFDSSTHHLKAYTLENGAWSAGQTLDTNTSAFGDVGSGMDDAGRVHVAWVKGNDLWSARLNGITWTSAAKIVTGDADGGYYFMTTVDPSGEAMTVWYQSDGMHSASFR